MIRGCKLIGVLTISSMVISFIFLESVSGDNEPNNRISESENITVGKYTGTVLNIGDYEDWYKMD